MWLRFSVPPHSQEAMWILYKPQALWLGWGLGLNPASDPSWVPWASDFILLCQSFLACKMGSIAPAFCGVVRMEGEEEGTAFLSQYCNIHLASSRFLCSWGTDSQLSGWMEWIACERHQIASVSIASPWFNWAGWSFLSHKELLAEGITAVFSWNQNVLQTLIFRGSPL